MKKKIELKKLKLNKEKIVSLSQSEKQNVIGGVNDLIYVKYQWSIMDPCSLHKPTEK